MLRTSPDRLHRAPHVPALRQQVPPGRDESIGIDTSTLVASLERAVSRVVEDDGPDRVPVPSDDGICAAEVLRFLWIQSGVYPAEHDRCAPGFDVLTDFVAAKRIARVDPDADDVTGPHAAHLERLQGFIGDLRPSMGCRRCRGEDEQPTRCDDADSEREMARIHQMHSHIVPSPRAVVTRQTAGDREAVSEMSTSCCPQTSRRPAAAILSWLLFPREPRGSAQVSTSAFGRPTAREPACVHGSRRTGHEPAQRRDPERSVRVPLISLASTGLCVPRPSVSSLRTSSVVTTGRERCGGCRRERWQSA